MMGNMGNMGMNPMMGNMGNMGMHPMMGNMGMNQMMPMQYGGVYFVIPTWICFY